MRVLLSIAAAVAAASLDASSVPVTQGAAVTQDTVVDVTRTYHVVQTTHLTEVPAGTKRVNWWISIPDDDRYQDVLDMDVVSTPGTWRIVHDLDRGQRFLLVEVNEPKTTTLDAVIEFTLRRDPVLVDLEAASIRDLTDNTRRIEAQNVRRDAPHMVVTKELADIADTVCGNESNPAVQARHLMEYVATSADHYSKDPTKPKCGIGSAEDCMTNGGGCCTDLHSLFITLARARGIPARLQMGYRLNAKNEGLEYDPGYRCWAEYFIPGEGWVPTDIVEADALGGRGPQRWFSGLTEWRLWLNQGREFRFEGMASKTPINTMVIGHAEIDGRTARVLPMGELQSQHSRTIRFNQVAN